MEKEQKINPPFRAEGKPKTILDSLEHDDGTVIRLVSQFRTIKRETFYPSSPIIPNENDSYSHAATYIEPDETVRITSSILHTQELEDFIVEHTPKYDRDNPNSE